MELLAKVGVIVVVLIALSSLAFILLGSSINTPLSSQQAVNLVINDMRSNSPSANISVIAVTPSELSNNSWNIVLSVVYNATRPCPTLFIEGFDYPATGFVPSVDNLYTTNCTVYGLSDAPSYVISSPYIAIARSYAQRNGTLSDYVSRFGYNNTDVRASFYANITANMTPLNASLANAWLINYTARGANYSDYVVLSSSGAVLESYSS